MYFTNEEIENMHLDDNEDWNQLLDGTGYIIPLYGLTEIGERVFGVDLYNDERYENSWIDPYALVRVFNGTPYVYQIDLDLWVNDRSNEQRAASFNAIDFEEGKIIFDNLNKDSHGELKEWILDQEEEKRGDRQ